jgi:hypothetical protein
MLQFIRAEYDLDEIARKGTGRIGYKVTGYRDRDVVELEIERRDRNDQLWTIKPSNSRYVSRDYEEEKNEIVVMENTVAALQDAITLGREIEQKLDYLESLYQVADAVRKVEAERKRAEELAAYNADAPVGMKLAKHIIKQMAFEIKAKNGGSYDEITIQLASRGKRKIDDLNVRFARSGLTLFSLGYYRISKDSALERLADSAIDGLKVDGINVVDPKLAKFMMV